MNGAACLGVLAALVDDGRAACHRIGDDENVRAITATNEGLPGAWTLEGGENFGLCGNPPIFRAS